MLVGYRSLQDFFLYNARKANNDLSYKCTLNDQARLDLQWWKTCIDQVNGKSFSSVDPDVVIYSDASLTGWGAYLNDRTARGPWTLPEKNLHINELELLGAYNAIRSLYNKIIQFPTRNQEHLVIQVI